MYQLRITNSLKMLDEEQNKQKKHYVIDQSIISIFDMKKIFGAEAVYNYLHRHQWIIIYLIFISRSQT